MDHLLTHSKEGKVHEGLLYPLPELCRRCFFVWRKECCGNVIGEVAKCKYGRLYFQKFDDICFIGIPLALETGIEEYVDFDSVVALMTYILCKVKNLNAQYDKVLSDFHQFIKALLKPLYFRGNRPNAIPLKGNYCLRLKDFVTQLNDITQEVSSTISLLDNVTILLPKELKKSLCQKFNVLSPFVGTGFHATFSLEQLHFLRDIVELPTLGLSISGQTGLKTLRLEKELVDIKNRFLLFDDWIHDVNHYMSRIQMVLPQANDCELKVDDMHSLEALVDALKILKNEFEEELGVSVTNGEMFSQGKLHPFDVYKLFHKYRYCFYCDNVYFVPCKNRFKRKLRPIPGVGTIALNLYHNAVKYLAEYSGRHDIETEFIQKHDRVDIVISSMGPVVRDNELVHLGEKGFRAIAARNSHRGNGKGLARVVKVCRKAGFEYKFSSERSAVDDFGFAKFTAVISIPNQMFVESKDTFIQ